MEDLSRLNQSDAENSRVREILVDSIESWGSRGLRNMSGYVDGQYEWRVDELIFNSTRDRLFGWILKISTLQDSSSLDFLKFVSGEKRENTWYLYLHNMPSIYTSRRYDVLKFSGLSILAKKEALKGGLFNNSSCTVSDAYINGWIDREGRRMYEWHQAFLGGK